MFESTIQEIAQQTIRANLAGLIQACGTEEKDLWPHPPEPAGRLGGVAIGFAYGWDWGIRVGIGWRLPTGGSAPHSVACASIRVSASYKKDKVFRALKKSSLIDVKQGINIDASKEGYHEVLIWSLLDPESDIAAIGAAMSKVLEFATGWTAAVGNLQGIVYGDSQLGTAASQPTEGTI